MYLIQPLAALLAVCIFQGAALAQDTAEPVWGLPQLMQSLHQVQSARAHFTEHKYLHILTTPVEASGTLFYIAPDKLEKNTTLPKPERLAVYDNTLTIERPGEGESRTLQLQDYPEVWAFVESIRSTLAGDLPTLSKFYEVTLSGDESRWELALEPKERKMHDLVQSIRITGTGVSLREINTQEGDGDRSDMIISDDRP